MLEELPLDAFKLPVEQVAADLDEADDHIGTDFRVFMLDPFPERSVIRTRQTIQFP